MTRGVLPLSTVIEHVAFECDRSVADVLGPLKHRRLAWARHMISWLARRHTRATHRQIGAALGGRCMEAAVFCVRRADMLRLSDEFFAWRLGHIDDLLTEVAHDISGPVAGFLPSDPRDATGLVIVS